MSSLKICPDAEPAQPVSHQRVAQDAHFAVVTQADPAALPRVLEHFALRDLVPSEVRVARQPGHDSTGDLAISIRVGGLDAATTGVITRKLGAMVCVRSALGHVDEGVEPLALI